MKNLSKLVILVVFLCLITFFSWSVKASVFYSPLRLGSEGLEVKMLQMILNLDPLTKVSVSGLGSPGRETAYFGEKTQSAVAKFQAKFKIQGENGRLGPLTRAELNKLVDQLFASSTSATISQPIGVSLATKPSSQIIIDPKPPSGSLITAKPLIDSISPKSGGNQTHITIKGKNFLPTGNTIKIGYADIYNVSSSDSETINFTFNFPEESVHDGQTFRLREFSNGNNKLPVYLLITNTNGDSNPAIYEFIF